MKIILEGAAPSAPQGMCPMIKDGHASTECGAGGAARALHAFLAAGSLA